MARTILFVGMVDSPHAAKWIRLVADQGWDLHFFPVYHARPHALLRNITVYMPWVMLRPRQWMYAMLDRLKGKRQHRTVRQRVIYPLVLIRPLDRVLARILSRIRLHRLGESNVCAPIGMGPRALARIIRQVKPDVIHSMEFQHAGYLTLRTKEQWGKHYPFPQWLATNWGSDIYYYQRFDDHRSQISRLLAAADYYSCECVRDIALAQQLGFAGQVMPVLPNTGGFDIAAMEAIRGTTPPSTRKLVMVKGYQHFAGRSLTALDALEQCREALVGYEIVLFSTSRNPAVHERAAELKRGGIAIRILDHSSHETMLQHFAQARIYLGVSISDAISTSMLEAMATGAFPIQTNTACCDEWIKDGVTGFSIPPEDVEYIAQKIRIALQDDALVDNAATANWEVARDRLDQRQLKMRQIAFYDTIFNSIEAS